LFLGAGNDLYLKHDGTDSYFQNSTGNLYISNDTDDGDVILRCDDGSGGVTPYLTLDGSATATLLHKTTKAVDGVYLGVGDSTDFYMHHSTNSFMTNGTGRLEIRNQAQDQDIRFSVNDGGSTSNILTLNAASSRVGIGTTSPSKKFVVKGASGDQARFEHNGSVGSVDIYSGTDGGLINVRNASGTSILELDGRSTAGASKLGAAVATTLTLPATGKLYLDGGGDTYIEESSDDFMKIFVGGQQMLGLFEGSTDSVFAPDNVRLGVGNSPDLVMYHDASNSHILNSTGDLYIKNAASDEDIYLQVSDGGSTVTAISIDASEVGRVLLPNDNQQIRIGADQDLRFYHDGNSHIQNNSTGHLYIDNYADDHDIILRSDDGSGGVTAYLTLDGSAAKMVADKSMLFKDSQALQVGDAGDASFFHNGTYTNLTNSTGSFYIDNNEADTDIIFRNDDGSGGLTAYLTLDGSATKVQIDKNMVFSDDVQAQFGGNVDLRIYSDDSNSYIDNENNDLIIQNDATDKDIILKSDNGSGGLTNYIQLDGSEVETVFNQKIKIEDDKKLCIGTGRDLEIYHDGTDDIINTKGTAFKLLDNGTERLRINSSGNIVINENGNSMDFRVEGDTDANLLFVDGSADRVGIGTGSPSFKLKVNVDNGTYSDWETIAAFQSKRGADSETEAGIMINSLGDALGGQISSNWYWTDNTGAKGNTGRGAGIFGISNATNNESEFYWQTTAYNDTTLTTQMKLDNAQSLHVAADVVAYSTSVSDERFKDNIETIPNALDKVMQLRGVEFDWNATSRKGQHDLGVVAQEVEKVLPELVKEKTLCTGEFTDNEKEFKTVDYDKIVAVLIEAVKQQQEEIELLKANYSDLKYNRR
jgi:hypothetical protein